MRWPWLLPVLMLTVNVSRSHATVGVSDTLSYGGSTYYLLAHGDHSALYWGEAESYSQAVLGAHLVAIGSAQENSVISQWLLGNSAVDYEKMGWIGFTDSAAEGQWEWASGEPVTYANWGTTGAPNNVAHDGQDEDYAVINWAWFNGLGEWNDLGDWYNTDIGELDPSAAGYHITYAVAERPVPELPPGLLVAGLPLAGLGLRRLRRCP